ncbi:hypothetical protein F4860DRAFT_515080 [Xylaria cubensis]|nr:hypothetical protein F4860DRAFT_515080 [Xylaria cubensis]
MATLTPTADSTAQEFMEYWQNATAENNLTLQGFRRFKTTHLLNLRFLEGEVAALDHIIYQAGLSLDLELSPSDRLGLRHSKRDAEIPQLEEAVTRESVRKLRSLLKEYDDALLAFNKIMSMETFSLLDDEKQSSLRKELSLNEIYKTRLVRADLSVGSRTDPFQRCLHKYLRAFRYWRLSKSFGRGDSEAFESSPTGSQWRYQNTILIAEVARRVITLAIIGVFLILPLSIITHQSKNIQIAIISCFILVFSFIITAMLKVSSVEMIAVSAAYAAVLATFVSNGH